MRYFESQKVTLIMRVMHEGGLSYKEIFFIWAVARSVIFVIRLIFLTPSTVPAIVDGDYNIYDNRYLKCGSEVSPEDEKRVREDDGESFKVVLVNYQFYVAVLAIAVYALRASTFVSWLSAGWPEWVARGFLNEGSTFANSLEEGSADGGNPEREFSKQINTFMSIGNLAVIFVNMLSGAIVDFCRRKSSDDRIGSANGLMICYAIVAIFSVLTSVFASFRIEWTGMIVS